MDFDLSDDHRMVKDLHKMRGAACRIHGCFLLAQMDPDDAQTYVAEGLVQTNALLDMIDSRVAELQSVLNEPEN